MATRTASTTLNAGACRCGRQVAGLLEASGDMKAFPLYARSDASKSGFSESRVLATEMGPS